jgi:DNA-binding XRE family transcriptional regulator
MARNYKELQAKMSPERRARAEAWVKRERDKMPLYLLRNAREMTQENLAKVLGVPQGTISKMEHRTDMYLSTLRSYIEAMGGTLELRAVFQDGAVNVELGKQEQE